MIRRRLALLGSLLASACSPANLLNATVSSAGTTRTRDVPYGPGPRHTLDIYRPTAEGGRLPLVVFIYGGSWTGGSKDIYPFVGEPLARRGVVVVIPDYRLSPEVAYPAFLQDNAEAVRWAFAHADSLGADPARIVLMGHSAGAFNAAMLALDPQWLGPDRLRIVGTVGLAGPYNFLPTHDPDVIPVFGAANDPANQPYAFADTPARPMFLAAGTEDTIVSPRNTTDLAARLRAAGNPVETRLYPGLGHIGLITAFAPLFQHRAPVLEDTWRFILQTTSSPSPSPSGRWSG